MKFYATAGDGVADPMAPTWTVSVNPGVVGWDTEDGYGQYGLTKDQAVFLADAANEKLAREGEECVAHTVFADEKSA